MRYGKVEHRCNLLYEAFPALWPVQMEVMEQVSCLEEVDYLLSKPSNYSQVAFTRVKSTSQLEYTSEVDRPRKQIWKRYTHNWAMDRAKVLRKLQKLQHDWSQDHSYQQRHCR